MVPWVPAGVLCSRFGVVCSLARRGLETGNANQQRRQPQPQSPQATPTKQHAEVIRTAHSLCFFCAASTCFIQIFLLLSSSSFRPPAVDGLFLSAFQVPPTSPVAVALDPSKPGFIDSQNGQRFLTPQTVRCGCYSDSLLQRAL